MVGAQAVITEDDGPGKTDAAERMTVVPEREQPAFARLRGGESQ